MLLRALIVTVIFISSLPTLIHSQHNRWVIKGDQHTLSKINPQQKRALGLRTKVLFKDLNLYLLEINQKLYKTQIIKQIFKSDETIEVYPDIEIELRAIPNDPDYPAQWGLGQINMPEVWDITTGGQAPNGDDIVVAIFDDGYDVTHRDYVDNIWVNESEIPDNGIDDDGNGYIDDYLGWNATTDNDEHRLRSHGTAVAGIIGAIGDNNTLVAGVNWNVKLMLTSGGRNDNFSLADIVKAYEYIYEQRKIYNESNGSRGAYVVVSNYSGGAPNLFPEDFPSWCDIYELLGLVGVLNFTSAPNSDVDVEVVGDMPALCTSDYLILVTNSDRQDNKVDFAGYGAQSIDLAAPGDGIATTGINGELDPSFTGASASAPFVAGIASLLYSVICEESYELSLTNPEEVNRSIRNILLSSVVITQTLQGRTTTGGRIDGKLAIDQIRSERGLGDCCNIAISSINITEETCTNSSDTEVNISIDTTDLRGTANFQLSSNEFDNITTDGMFSFISSGNYNLTVSAERDNNCAVDTTLNLLASIEPCSFSEFGVSRITPNPTSSGQITLSYDLDEAKAIEVVAYNSLGQLVYRRFVPSNGSGSGVVDVDLGNLSAGVYHVGIRANDLLDTESFIIAR